MAITPMYFTPLTPDQANPGLYAQKQRAAIANQWQDNTNKILQNQQLNAQVPYAGQMAQQELQKAQLANETSGVNLQYLPQDYQTQFALRGAQTGEAGAQTGLINQQAKYLPLDTLIKAQNANQSSDRFGKYYQLAKSLQSMPTAARATWIAQNQDSYNQMLTTLGNGNVQQSYLTPQIMQKFFPEMQGQPQAPQQPNQGAMAQQPQWMQQQSAQAMPAKQQPQVMPQRPYFVAPTAQQNSQVALANQMSANKALTTNATQRQMEGAIQVEGIMNDPKFQQQVLDASNYAGALRKGQAAIDALSQSNPNAYENYLAFKNQTMVLLESRIKTLDQMGATDKQREDLENLHASALNSLTSNPDQFVTQMNKLKQTLDTISHSVQKSASPISPVNRLQDFQDIGSGNNNPTYFNTDRVNVVSSDGKKGTIPANQLQAALKAGYKQAN